MKRGLPRTEVRGQSLFEMVMSFAVVTLIVVGIVSAATISIRNAAYSRNKTLADRYLQEALEWLRSEKNNDYSAFAGRATVSLRCINSLGWVTIGTCPAGQVITGTIFGRELALSTITISGGKLAIRSTVTVYWTDSQGRHESSAVTDFADWQ